MRTFRPKITLVFMLIFGLACPADAAFRLYVDGQDLGPEVTIEVGSNIWLGIHNDVENQYQHGMLLVLYEPAAASWTGGCHIYIPPNVPGAECPDGYSPDSGSWVCFLSWVNGIPNDFYGVGILGDLEFHCDCEGDAVIELYNAANMSLFDTLTVHQIVPEPNEPDLGDAPDSTNNYGVPMTAYPDSGVPADFPTVFNDGNSAGPFGPIHYQSGAVAYLGDSVTVEDEADIGPDQDPNNNIDPNLDIADLDLGDDGVVGMPLFLPHCGYTSFDYLVNIVEPNVTLFVNAWFDFNRDGDWGDTIDCDGYTVAERAVQQILVVGSGVLPGIYQITSSEFLSWHPSAGLEQEPIWMRITISTQQWTDDGAGGSGPADGYEFGETEDYYFTPDTGCFPYCHPDYDEWIARGQLLGMPQGRGPECWCGSGRQCHGDADGVKTGNPFGGYSYVGTTDLAIFAAAWGILEPPLGPGIASVPNGICCDFAHDLRGVGFYGYTYVGTTDLAIFATYWNVMEPTWGPGIPDDCLDCP